MEQALITRDKSIGTVEREWLYAAHMSHGIPGKKNIGWISMKTKPVFWLFLVLVAGVILISPVMGAVPVASFISNATTGTVPFTVQFMDTSVNTPTSWTWLFGDGGISSSQDPAHTYTTAGTYTVTLIATNAAGSNTLTNAGYITVTKTSSVPVVSFVTNITSGVVPLSVQFVDASTNSPSSWVWSFGDGGTSTLQNPAHTYTAAGTYAVTLTATNTIGSNTVTQPGYITVNAAVPVTSFTANVTSGVKPLTVQFTDTSNNTPTGWYWTFGDGGTSSSENPVYTFSSVGSYAVSLGATNSAGSNTTTMPAYINVTNTVSPPFTSFIADIQSGNAPLTVQFTDTSGNSPNGWQWSFGDGTMSTEQNPYHTYTQGGTYSVSLTAVNSGGHNTTALPGYIVVSAPVVTATPTQVITTVPQTLATAAEQPTETQSAAVTTASPGSGGSSSWTLPFIGVVILVLVIIALVLYSGGRSGGRRRSRGGDL
jgi:PKD repeat protein